MKRAVSVARDQLVSLGVCVGKFTHSDKFKLTIGALELLATHAKHKVRAIFVFSSRDVRRRAFLEQVSVFRFVFSSKRVSFFRTPGSRLVFQTKSAKSRSVGVSRRRPMMRRISVFNLNLRDENLLV
jgi:ribosome biogenesis protein Nip4